MSPFAKGFYGGMSGYDESWGQYMIDRPNFTNYLRKLQGMQKDISYAEVRLDFVTYLVANVNGVGTAILEISWEYKAVYKSDPKVATARQITDEHPAGFNYFDNVGNDSNTPARHNFAMHLEAMDTNIPASER